MSKLPVAGFIGCLWFIACAKTENETRMESSPETQAVVTALRGAYAAFNRGDIDAAVESMESKSSGRSRPSSLGEARTAGAKALSAT